MKLKGFIKECHEKEVFKMISIYLVSSWVVLQVLALIAEPLNFPEKSITYLILILIIGFPIHIYFIWKFRLKKLETLQPENDSLNINKSAFHKMYISSLVFISLISAFSVLVIFNTNLEGEFKLQNAISNNKIAVLKFDDFTGDSKLEAIGDMAANWIIHGITENEIAQVISPKVVSDYTNIIKSQAGTLPNAKELLKTYFKPGKIISGGFYKEKNKLLLQGSITDGSLDETLISFETIDCDEDSPLDCIEILKQKILGYLTILDNKVDSGYIMNEDKKVSYFEETPPKFKAYQYNFSALKLIENDSLHLDFLNKAINEDPNYFEPKIHLINYYYNNGEYRTCDSLIKKIDMNSKLSSRQQNYLFEYESIIKGRNDKAYIALKKEYDMAYMDIPTNMSAMVLALQFVNRPRDIDAFYKEIPMGNLNLDKCYQCSHRYYIKGLADIELKKYKQVVDELLPVTNLMENNIVKKPLIMAYVRTGDLNALNNEFKSWEFSIGDKIELMKLYMFAGNEFLLAQDKDNAKLYFNKVIHDAGQIKDSVDVAYAYYYNEDYKTAQNLLEKLYISDPKNISTVVKLAISNFKNGNYPKTDQYMDILEALRADYQFGEVDYGLAQYYASINDKENAFDYLKKAVSSGWWFTATTFQNDPHFLIYRNTKEFDEILNYWNQFLK